jgi:hypothetical protein
MSDGRAGWIFVIRLAREVEDSSNRRVIGELAGFFSALELSFCFP